MTRLELHKKIMKTYFLGTQPDGYDVFDYYGVMIMKYKKNGKYQIKLQYDYKNRNMINGKSKEFTDFKAVVKAYELLEEFSRFSKEETKIDEMQNLLLGE